MPSAELALVEEQMAKRFGRMVAQAARVVDIADRTCAVPRDPETGGLIRQPGMTDEEWNIHCDAMMSNRNVPVYLASQLERVALAQKLAGLRGVEVPRIAGYVVQLMEQKKYPVVDVEESK